MVLSQTAEYALRAMAWLALYRDDGPVRATDLSAQTDIPTPYLSKILRRLVLRGMLTSQKGHGGGFVLAKAPSEIRFVDILEAIEAVPEAGGCMFGWGRCNSEHPCPLHPAWERIAGTFHDWIQNTTLADIGSIDDETLRVRGVSTHRD